MRAVIFPVFFFLFVFAPVFDAAAQHRIIARAGGEELPEIRDRPETYEGERPDEIEGSLAREADEWTASLRNRGDKSFSVVAKLVQLDKDGRVLGTNGVSAQLSPGQRISRRFPATEDSVAAELRLERASPLG